VRTSKPRVQDRALISLLPIILAAATLIPVDRVSAASIDGSWVWPPLATANSCRWARVQVGLSATEEIYSCTISGLSEADGYAPGSTLPLRTVVQSGTSSVYGRLNQDTTVMNSWGHSPRFLTIGPFCGRANAFNERPADWPFVVGYGGSPGSTTTRPTNANTYYVTFTIRTYNTDSGEVSDTVLTSQPGYRTVHDNDDYLDWNRPGPGGTTIDPISVGPVEVLADSGSGSSAYKFRVRYTSGLYSGLNLPPRWRTSEDFPPSSYDNSFYDRARGWPSRRSDPDSVTQFNWLYGRTTDPWLDQVGYARSEYDQRGATEPQVLLVIDGQHWAPHYMMPEDPADTTYTDGAMFTYTVRPTDYLNFIDNIFLFPFDLPGQDAWDNYAVRLAGRPASNNYVSLTAGPHTYEFWATDDFAPVGNRGWVQVGWPGNDAHVEYLHRVAPEARRVDGLRSGVHRSRQSVYNQQQGGPEYSWTNMRRFGDTSVNQPDPYGYTLKSHNALSDSDIPSDLEALGSSNPALSLRKLPNVNPVLTAHPFFGLTHREGGMTTLLPSLNGTYGTPDFSTVWSSSDPIVAGGYIDNDIPNNAAIPGGAIGANPDPFAPETGVGPVDPWKYTNDDTILPNFANIWNEISPTPFRGGKWTASTNFTLRVNYWHSENVAPRFMRVYIRRNDPDSTPGAWFSYTMEKASPADNDYTDGCVFQYQATPDQLPTASSQMGGGIGEYNYYFEAIDSTRTARFPDRPDRYTFRDENNAQRTLDDPGDVGVPVNATGQDYYWFRVNQKPILENASVTPTVGNTGDPFTFRVTYRDADGEASVAGALGDRPFIAYMYVDIFGDLYGTNSLSVDPVSESELSYTNSTAHTFTDNELAGLYVVMEDGAAVRKTYRIVSNSDTTINLVADPNDPDHPGLLQTDGAASGDVFYIAQRTAMAKEDSSDDDYTDGVVYVFNTGTNIILGPGNHRYFFEFADDWGSWTHPNDTNVHVEGEYVRFPNALSFAGPQVIANTAPELVDFRFLPQDVGNAPDGSTSTPFIFYVTYVDQENNAPSFIRLELDGTTTLNLFPDDPGDTVYTDGVVYRSAEIQLTEGQHFMRAQASDGEERYPPQTAYPPSSPLPFMGPVASVSDPVGALTLDYSVGGKVFPDGRFDGGAGITIRMLDGSAAGNVYTIASNADSTLTIVDDAVPPAPAVNLGGEGVTAGDHFIFDAAPGPKVAANTSPRLVFPDDDDEYDPDPTSPQFPGLEPDSGVPSDPASGTQGTEFTYTVIYIDDDLFAGVRGNPPTYVQVYIDNVAHDMQPVDPSDSDYTENGGGAEYTYTAPVPPGLSEGTPHTYFFIASDGLDTARLPALGTLPNDRYNGPIVDGRPDNPEQLFVFDTPDDNGDSIQFRFNASLDDGGGADDVVEYHLYRNETGAPFADPPVIVIEADNKPSYAGIDPPPGMDTGLQKAVPYYYMVRAYDGPTIDADKDGLPDKLPDDGDPATPDQYVPIDPLDQSFDSNVEGPVSADDNISPGAPTFLNAVDPADGGIIDLNWGPSPDDGAGYGDVIEYRLYRELDAADLGTNAPLYSPLAGATEYRDMSVTDGTEYYYAIAAWDGVNESDLTAATPSPVTSSDAAPPEILNLSPDDGDADVARDTNIEFDVRDTGAGVDINSLQLIVSVNGVPTTIDPADLTITTTGDTSHVVYDPPTDFEYLVAIQVHVEVSDLSGDATADPIVPPNTRTLDYRFTIAGPPVYEIEGTIIAPDALKAEDPDVLEGITVRAYPVTGGLFIDATTDAAGNYVVEGLAEGDYYVVPSKPGLAFTPAQSVPLHVPPSPQRADFTAQKGYTMVGSVTDTDDAPLPGVRVSNGVREVTTAADGTYQIEDVAADEYTLVAQLDGYAFEPQTLNVTVPTDPADPIVNVPTFVGDVERFFVSGTILASDGSRLEDIVVELLDQDGQPVAFEDPAGQPIVHRTNASGAYFIDGVAGGFYSVKPTDVDWVFNPAQRDVNVTGNTQDIDFTGYEVYKLTLSPGLQMVAIPVVPQNLNPVMNVPAGVDVARWDPTRAGDDKYIKGDPGSPLPVQYEMTPGRSFWLRNNTGADAQLTIQTLQPVDTSIDFSLSLEGGWNMAGNMLDRSLPWSALHISPGQSVRDYGFLHNPQGPDPYIIVTDMLPPSADGTLTDTVPKNAGFWIKADHKQVVTVATAGLADAEKPSLKLSAGDYLVPIVVRADNRADSLGLAGVVQGSDDSLQIENPPALSPFVDLYFANSDGGRLACDVRSASAGSDTWDFVVATDMVGATVELALPDLSGVPAEKSVTLVDQATGKRLYARTLGVYSYAADESGTRKFRLEIGPKTESGLVVSAATARQTGTGAAVAYTLSTDANVTVTVMNISGRVVREVGGGAATKGANTVAWNLRSQSGTRVPSGRYLVRIEAEAENGQVASSVTGLQVSR